MPPYDLTMTSVLLAEDDPSISEPLARALRREGYEVGVSAAGPDTIEAARAGGIDLIVLAVGELPRLDDPSTATVPVTVGLSDQAVATRLALANSVAKIDLLREPAGATSRAAIPAASAPGAAQ